MKRLPCLICSVNITFIKTKRGIGTGTINLYWYHKLKNKFLYITYFIYIFFEHYFYHRYHYHYLLLLYMNLLLSVLVLLLLLLLSLLLLTNLLFLLIMFVIKYDLGENHYSSGIVYPYLSDLI